MLGRYTYADGRTELQYGTDRTLSLDMPGSKGQVILPLAAIGDSNAAAGQTTRLVCRSHGDMSGLSRQTTKSISSSHSHASRL
jgi:hypothetical protein